MVAIIVKTILECVGQGVDFAFFVYEYIQILRRGHRKMDIVNGAFLYV